MTTSSGGAVIVAGLAIGLGLASGGYFVSRTMINSARIDTADVKGLAERTVAADQATWQIGFKVSNPDLKAGYADVAANAVVIRAFLAANGFKAENISAGPTAVTENVVRDANGALVEKSYDIVSSIIVTAGDVKAVEAANQKVGDLIATGLLLTDSQPHYLFSGLNAIKPEMLREATQNARVAADEFAKNAGIAVGSIRSATQGGFEVHDINSTGDYPTDDLATQKTVRVVTNVSFYLE